MTCSRCQSPAVTAIPRFRADGPPDDVCAACGAAAMAFRAWLGAGSFEAVEQAKAEFYRALKIIEEKS